MTLKDKTTFASKVARVFSLKGRRSSLRHVEKRSEMVRASEYAASWPMAQCSTGERPDSVRSLAELPNPLREYFESHVEGQGIWKWLHYFDIYHRHLGKFVGREVHIVEIGIFSGGSLDMWKHYFGPECRVYGVDIEPACKKYEDEKTKIFIGDQANRGFWKAFREAAPAVDILIDDGGHLPEQQIVTLEEMLPHLRPGGVYICEDVHSLRNRFAAYAAGLADSLNAFVESGEPSAFQRDIHSVHLYPFVTVIEKCSLPRLQFSSLRRGTQWEPFAEKMPGWVPKH